VVLDVSTVLPAAVLWDMDGTLVDTEPYWMASEVAVVHARGGMWTHDDGLALVGNPLRVSAECIRRHGGVDLPVDEVVERLLAHVVVRVGERPPWRPGARELLADLGRVGVPCALVTMSWTSLAEAVVSALPAGTFAAVVTGDEVTYGKPHPEPYLTAAARLGVDPAECVAVEDSPTGLLSAEAAGAVAVGVPHLVPLPTRPGRTLLSSLTGVTAADLGQLVSARTTRRCQSVSEP
jgi:HAD superfamily hydrolase (TIGR01509 family)